MILLRAILLIFEVSGKQIGLFFMYGYIAGNIYQDHDAFMEIRIVYYSVITVKQELSNIIIMQLNKSIHLFTCTELRTVTPGTSCSSTVSIDTDDLHIIIARCNTICEF